MIQAICFLQTGSYCKDNISLRKAVQPAEQKILDTEKVLKASLTITEKQFDEATEMLFLWAQKRITDIENSAF